MRRILLALLFVIAAIPALAQGAPPQIAANQPYTIEYYYKVQWGHQQEFLTLFLKNHYPLLKKIVESGRMSSVKIEARLITPRKTAAGITASPSATPTAPSPPPPIPTKKSSSTRSTQTSRPTCAKSNAASKSSSRTGTCP